jgi:TusA-related sulfurtransferase
MSTIKKIIIDARGLQTPIPELRIRTACETINSGDLIEIAVTEPKIKNHIDAISKILNIKLLGTKEVQDVIIFLLQKENG